MNFNIKDFTGPLDLLLHMIKRHEMNIYDVDLKIIIDEYIQFINLLDSKDLDHKSEYLIMASELIHLKSKLLLGFDDEEKDDSFEINSEEDLKERLIEYAKYQEVSSDFRTLEAKRHDYYTKLPENIKQFSDNGKIPLDLDIKLLIDAFLEMQERCSFQKPRTTKITRKEINVKDKINYIRQLLNADERVEFTSLFIDYSKEELVVTLLSILEMSKNKEVILFQNQNFSKIYIEVYHE